MSLYVVAWPILSEADDTALRRLRAQYHPTEANLIGPHFTLVFSVPDERESELRAAIAGIERRPFWFMIDRIVRRHDLYLCAEPSDGADELRDLYEALNRSGDFEPHLTLGKFSSAAEAERIARIVGRQHLPMRGRIEELALLKRGGDALETLTSRSLG